MFLVEGEAERHLGDDALQRIEQAMTARGYAPSSEDIGMQGSKL